MHTVIQAAARLVCPTDPDGLSALFLHSEAPPIANRLQDNLVSNVVAAMKATKRGTLARRYFRCMLAGDAMSRADVNEVLGHPPEPPEHSGSISTFAPLSQSRSTGSTTWLGRQAEEANDQDNNDDDDDCEDDESDCRGLNAGSTNFPRMSSKTFSRSKRDWKTLVEYGELQPAKFGRARVQDDALRQLLAFLFSPENISLVSWTRQRIVAHDRALDLPAVVCSKKGGVLHDEYCKLAQKAGKKPLSRGSFYAVVKTLTRREIHRVLPVDNMTLTLVKDPLTLLRDLIMRLIPYPHRVNFLKQVDKVEWFLIHSFVESHIGKDSSGCHDLQFALLCDSLQSSPRQMFDRPVHCAGYQSPFVLLDRIYAAAGLNDASPDTQTLGSCHERFQRYLGWLCAKSAQDRAIEGTFNEIASKKLRSRVVIFTSHLNYSDALRPAESQVAPSLEKVTMHGSVVYSLASGDRTDSGFQVHFYNHVVRSDSQIDAVVDARVVAFVVEALLHRVREDLPHANEVVFVNDNASSYKNHILPSLLPLLASSAGFRAVRYIYSCSQVCQFLTEALFEVVTTLTPGDVQSPEHIVNEINTQQKLPSMGAQLILLGREYEAFANSLQNGSSMFPSIGDRNDVVYQAWKASDVHAAGNTSNLSVVARLRDYAGIGKGQSFEIMDSLLGITGTHLERDKRGLGTAQAAWQGSITGVRVIRTARRLTPFKRWKQLSLDGVSGGLVTDTIRELHAVARKGAETAQESVAELEGPSVVSNATAGPTCAGCRRSFKNESCLKSHACKGPPVDKDVSARASVVASEMLRDGKLPVFRDASEQLSLSSLNFRGPGQYLIRSLRFGWARPPDEGRRRGLLSVGLVENASMMLYREEVFALLDKQEDGQNLSYAEMQRTLQAKFAGRVDIPTEKRLQYWCQLHVAGKNIQRFYMIGKDGTPIVSYEEDTQNAASGRSRMNPLYSKKITDMHEQYLKIAEIKRPKPRYMYKEFVNFFQDAQGRLPPDFPEQKQVMNKINALRTKSKQQ